MNAFKSGLRALDRAVAWLALHLACLLLAVISCLGLWQVVSRFVLSQPSTFTEEAMRRLLIWMVMLGVVAAFRNGALVCVDLMLRVSRGWWRQFVRTTITLASLAFLAVLVWFGVDLAWRVRYQTFASLDLSMAWAYAALPVGALLAMVSVIAFHFDPSDRAPDAQV
ncbi:MAG TPA: TRAP transporter small permease [Burkholderiaceae bacterium]|nr:TRAP transporter small permease [Burkholderiaceae bacterium]